MKMIVIDPPDGWRYDFPKSVPERDYTSLSFDLRTWLVTNGYPESEVDFALKHIRVWNRESYRKGEDT